MKERTRSGLAISTLKKYAKSENLEWFEGEPNYMHSVNCPSYCDYACNGQHGFNIAEDIRELRMEKKK